MSISVNPAGMNRQQMSDAIAAVRFADGLDALWSAWEEIGYSKEGLLYAELLERKVALGGKLSPEDDALLGAAETKRAYGESLPPARASAGKGEEDKGWLSRFLAKVAQTP